MALRGFALLTRRKGVVAVLTFLIVYYIYSYGSHTSPKDKPLNPQDFPPWPFWAVNPDPATQPRQRNNWALVPQNFPIRDTFTVIPPALPKGQIPKIQASKFPVNDAAARHVQQERLAAVKGNFTHAWRGYRKYAWMKDEVAPVSGGYHEASGGWADSLVDALGTLWIMNMTKEFEDAIKAVDRIDFSTSTLEDINVFETTIKYLGGLLSAYDLSQGKYPVLLEKATVVGEMLYHAFDTPNRLPIMRWKFRSALSSKPLMADGVTYVAEIGSLTVEFTRLSQITGDNKYFDAVERVMDVFAREQNDTKLPGMWPVVIDAKLGNFHNNHHEFVIAGGFDSLYEYLPKQYLMLGGGSKRYRELYEYALNTMKQTIFYRPMTPNNYNVLFAGKVKSNGVTPISALDPEPQAQHGNCFAGAMVSLGAKIFQNPNDMDVARKLVEGCLWGHETANQGLMPEIFHTVPCKDQENCPWDEDAWHSAVLQRQDGFESIEETKKRLPLGVVKIDDSRFILRPEAIESIWYLYRITGDPMYQERAWNIFNNITKHSITDIAHAAMVDCTIPNMPKQDNMESFWLAETLLYFYLIFADEDLISLDDWVLSTQAHPLKRPS